MTLFLAIWVWVAPMNNSDLETIREKFHQAVLDEDNIESFHKHMKSISTEKPVLKAYMAAAEAMLAQVKWNPVDKYSQAKTFKKLMSEAVQAEPEDIEIRFLRLSVEYNMPSFLGFSEHIEEDADFLMENLDSLDSLEVDNDFARFIVYFLKQTDLCDEEKLKKAEEKLSQG